MTLEQRSDYIGFRYLAKAGQGETVSMTKFGGYTVSLNHDKDNLESVSKAALLKATEIGFEGPARNTKTSLGQNMGYGRYYNRR